MIPGIPHPWNLSPEEAVALQKQLAAQVDTGTPIALDKLKLVAGVDVSVRNEVSRAAVVVLTYPELAIIETVTAQMPTPFPYIPGLLTFREGEVIMAAHAKLVNKPDAYIFDGMGIAHPRRMGIAAHLGLWLDAPTVGCGKTWLVGKHELVGPKRGDFEWMHYHGEVIGAALRTRDDVAVVYASPGNHATVETAKDLILRCARRYRLPEPVRAAHNAAG